MDRIPSISRSRMQVERFNAACDVGTAVTYHAGLWRRVSTVTASKAHLFGATPVVWVMGQGRVPLDRVRPQ